MGRVTMPRHYYVLPVLFLEFLAIAVTKSLVPELIVRFYGDRVYLVIGVVEQVKGVLAFFACPLFGKVSDVVGRKKCLFNLIIIFNQNKKAKLYVCLIQLYCTVH